MNILIADRFEERGIEDLKRHGCEVVYEPTLASDALRDAIQRTGCTVLIVRSTRVTEPMLSAASRLNLVVRAGAGVNTIDTRAASLRSILVANCPGKNAVAVAELTFALILALDRRVCENVEDLRQGRWNKKEYAQARGLKGRTLGIVGLGQIGQAVAERARAFEMHVIAWSRSLTADRAAQWGLVRCEDPADVASRCDILTIHLASTPQTKHLIDGDVLSQLHPGSYVINTSRAEVLDYEALADAVQQRSLRVGLDVFPDEPGSGTGAFSDPIVKAGGLIYGTHHIGASTDQAQEAIGAEAVRIVLHYLRTGRVDHCVNLCERSPARYLVVVRHQNRPGVLAHALGVIRRADVNVEEMENVICEGAEAACAHIKLDRPVSEAVLAEIQNGHEHVIGVSLFKIAD